MMVRRFVGRSCAVSRLVSAGAAGLLVCALGAVADAQTPRASSSMRLVGSDDAPAPEGGSLLRLIEPPAMQSESGRRRAESGEPAILPASGVEDGRGPKAGLIEVHDDPVRDEASYRQSLRARAMRQLHPGSPRLRTVADDGSALSIPQPPPDEESAAAPRRGLRTANLQAKAPDDLFAPPPAGNVPPAPVTPNQPAAPPPAAQPPMGSPFADEPPMQPAPAAQPPALPGADAPAAEPPVAPADPAITPLSQNNLLEVLASSGELTVTRRRNKILRSKDNIYRVAVVDPSVCDVVQFTPREVSIIGRGQGATNVTFWFADGKHKPLTYLVRVVPDPEVQVERERQYEIFEEVLAELFPDSKVRLTPVADKLIVRGQARDAAEAAQILTIIRGEAITGRNGNGGGYNANTLVDGQAATPLSNDATGNPMPASNIVNMLRVPGVQQVALRVKIAELNRSAARHFGVNLDMQFDVGSGALILQSLLNPPGTASIIGNFDNDQINFGVHYLKKHGVLRILSEPTLVTLSGRPAS
ncbi:MAG: pilus assembly protein N-terminal domain-containing protein, partial [Planctomycetia bacterium]|nr:pilus assembly protein N-terminal domain-containing protein [Planctomycetia bacterium]